MRAWPCALALLVATAASARADGPIVVRVGVGAAADLDINRPDTANFHHSPSTGYGPDLELDLAYRLQDFIAAGVHVGYTRHSLTTRSGNIPGADMVFDGDQEPVELGITVMGSYDRFWIAPWLGMVDVAGLIDERMLGVGASLGVDAWVIPSGHRLGAFAAVSRAITDYPNGDSYGNLYVAVGVAYRYW